ncbi:MAG: hypothetical protein KC609_07960, partial [Myxococcales bacterium]|nr:hypothetical protein [Myxococcales bacterium]
TAAASKPTAAACKPSDVTSKVSFDWKLFVSAAKDESRLLGSILEHAQFVDFADRALVLAPDEGFQTLLLDGNYRRQIEDALVRFAGPGCRLELADAPDPRARSLAKIADDQRRDDLAAKRQQIESNPLVQGGVRAVFPDAQLLSIRATLQEDP